MRPGYMPPRLGWRGLGAGLGVDVEWILLGNGWGAAVRPLVPFRTRPRGLVSRVIKKADSQQLRIGLCLLVGPAGLEPATK